MKLHFEQYGFGLPYILTILIISLLCLPSVRDACSVYHLSEMQSGTKIDIIGFRFLYNSTILKKRYLLRCG